MKHEELISKMTMEEKAVFLSGKTVWESRDIKDWEFHRCSALMDLMEYASRQVQEITLD